ncbi:MAG TPA: T9SS type A sorting domain-containing protein [Salinimicrobium catena]|uniref:T9SS type A sorting domain-containing protein n=1 Tax=Salinimicrobium catena TaxID=390640 RepID=A0A7C2M0U4_9FLAO|nr:T9SS type A sorting domain-containing protein [Salinimicrobium catena]
MVFTYQKIVVLQIFGLYSLLLFSQNHAHVNINQPAVLQADAGIDTTVKEGAAILLGGSPTATYGYVSYTYAWVPGDNLSDASSSNPEATVLNSIIYFVTVTDGMECTSTDSIAVTVNGATDILNQRADLVIKIMPNPNQGTFIIEVDNTTLVNGIDIIIRDMHGKVVYSRFTGIQKGKNKIPLNISTLPEGSYIIELYHESLQYIQRLVVY